MAGLDIWNRGDFMLWGREKGFTVTEMREMENALRNSVLYSLKLTADDNELSDKLGLKVEYVMNMSDDNEAELLPIDDNNHYGLIRMRKELKKYKFAYIHEIIHYIFDVGYGNKVTECYSRKKKGKTNSHEEQRTNYMTAAYIMPSAQIAGELYKYDHSVPKMDELAFIRTLQARYQQSETAVIRRIREVRKLIKSGESYTA